MKSHPLAALVALSLIVCALAGCSGLNSNPLGGPSGSGPSSNSSDAPSSAASAPGAPSQDVGSGPFPCNVFSSAYIKKVSGYDVVKALPITSPLEATQKSCEYIDAAQHAIGVEVAPGQGADALKLYSEIEGTGGPVSGIGDSAWGNESGLAVVFGNDYVSVDDESNADDDSVQLANIGLDTLKQMVLKLHAAMG